MRPSREKNNSNSYRYFFFIKEQGTAMRKSFYLILASLIFASSIISAQPRAYVEDAFIDLGKLAPGQAIPASEFKIFNGGTTPLEISDAVTKSDFATISFDKTNVEPGDFAIMRIDIDGKDLRGQIYVSASFATNEIRGARKSVAVKGYLSQEVDIFPSSPTLSVRSENPTVSFKVENNSGEELRVYDFGIVGDGASLGLTSEKTIAPYESETITLPIQINDDGPTKITISFKTSNDAQPAILLPVNVRLR